MEISVFIEIGKKLAIGTLSNGLLLAGMDMTSMFVFGDGRGG